MKPSELIRAIVIILIGVGLMLGLQPWLFVSETIFLGDVELADWVPSYAIGTYIVLGTTLMVTVIWFLLTSFATKCLRFQHRNHSCDSREPTVRI